MEKARGGKGDDLGLRAGSVGHQLGPLTSSLPFSSERGPGRHQQHLSEFKNLERCREHYCTLCTLCTGVRSTPTHPTQREGLLWRPQQSLGNKRAHSHPSTAMRGGK